MPESSNRYVTLSACAAVVILTGAAAFMLSTPGHDAHAQSGAKKAAKAQPAKKSEPTKSPVPVATAQAEKNQPETTEEKVQKVQAVTITAPLPQINQPSMANEIQGSLF